MARLPAALCCCFCPKPSCPHRLPSARTMSPRLPRIMWSDPTLSRAVWSGLEVAAILLRLLLKTFDQGGVLVFGIDETIERRRGEKIAAKGIYRDPVRSSKSHFVKASGLRWISLMWLTAIPWAQRIWALPFLTALAPSERYYQQRGRRAKKI